MSERLRTWLGFSALASAIGWAYGGAVGGNPAVGASVGLAIGASLVGLELFIVELPVGAPLRRLPLPWFVSVMTTIWIVIIALCLQLVPRLWGKHPYGADYLQSSFGQDLGFGLVVSLVFNAAMRIRSLVGTRVLANFLLGRYHRPLREERVFMFLDLADSTGLSERLGDERVQALIGRFFFDIARPIADHRGETHRYIGDEVVVTWPLDRAVEDARCIACVFAVKAHVAAHAARYEAEYGTVPRFRVGMHGGPVVVSEVGDDKRDIVYFGDTVNTAARLGAACKRLGHEFLVSGELRAMLALPERIEATSIGPVELEGKDHPIEVVALREAVPGRSPGGA